MHINAKAIFAEGGRRAGPGKQLMVWLVLFTVLDMVTTILGLSTGLKEMNPVVWSLIRWAGLNGLLLSKLLAVALAAYFLYSGRLLLLRRVTVLMGVVVGWNFFWLIAR